MKGLYKLLPNKIFLILPYNPLIVKVSQKWQEQISPYPQNLSHIVFATVFRKFNFLKLF